jgi:putative thioredoxin
MSEQELPRVPLRGAIDLSTLAKPPAQADGGNGSALVVELTEATLQGVAQQSMTVPVIVNLGSSASPASKDLTARLSTLASEYEGRFVLANCDVDSQPAIAQAFQVQAVPAVLALIAARPAPLFQGNAADEQVREVLNQVLEVAAQAGVTGRVATEAGPPAQEPEPDPLPPLHQEAFDAIERDDFEGAIAAFEKALRENPKDLEARAGLAQVRLMHRTRDADLSRVRQAAADGPEDIDAQFAVADLDMVGGKVDDAFARLIELVRISAGEERDRLRERLVEYFDVVGSDDPRVVHARQALASALY